MKKYIVIAIIIIISLCTFVAAEPGKVDRAGFPADTEIGVTKPHREIHEGESYCFGFNNTLGVGGATTFLINTPNDGTLGHIVFPLRCSGECNMKVYEDSTVSAVGTAVQSTRHNRYIDNPSTIIVTMAPTVTSLGNSLDGFEKHLGAGQTRGGDDRSLSELVMKPGTLYIANTVSEATNNDITAGGDYYQDKIGGP
jgi:hypothetical protein